MGARCGGSSCHARNTPCLEQVGLLTRAKEVGCLALPDDIEVTRETLLKLGRGKAYTRRREFEETFSSIASQKIKIFMRAVYYW
jgi:hypothetical protein